MDKIILNKSGSEKLDRNMREQMVAEEATGCVQHGHKIGRMYVDGGIEADLKLARANFFDGEVVEVPNAGAGSYHRVLEALGAEEVKPMETCSSAGDWTLAAKFEGMWYPVFQTNRYPYHGFSYSLDQNQSGETFEELCQSLYPQ